MNVQRPLCAVCFREPREPNSARCRDCGPGRISPSIRPPMSRLERAAQQLNTTDPAPPTE